jgi:hypothetical protein
MKTRNPADHAATGDLAVLVLFLIFLALIALGVV